MTTKLHYEMPRRRCTCCGEEKPLSEFYRQSYTGEPTNQCIQCINIKRSVVRHKAKHGKFVSKEKIRDIGSQIDYTLEDWRAAMLHFRGQCCYCGVPEGRSKASKFDREHLVPLSRGGHVTRENIVPACRRCNRGRGNRPLFEWFRGQEFWTAEREARIVQWMGEEAAREEGWVDEGTKQSN